MRRRSLAAPLLLALALAGCRSASYYPPPPAPEAPLPSPAATPEPSPEPLPAPKHEAAAEDPLAVEPATGTIVVMAWTEPSRLPPGGGSVQVLVRVKRPRGALVPGVEVRLATSDGTLYSAGRVLTTDERGMTRDRLTASKTSIVALNVGGKRLELRVPVAPRE